MENAYVLQLSDSKFKDLYLSFCGYAQCQPFHSFGPAARPTYIIHFILSGKGTYRVGEHKYTLHAGQGYLIEPEVMTYYQADGEDPWTYLWVGFSGERAAEYISDMGFSSNQLTFQSEHGNELRSIVLKMLKNNSMATSNQYLLQSLLFEFFYVLARDIVIETDESKESIYVKQAINYIRNNYSKRIKISDVAKSVSVNRSYLYKVFEKCLDMSPHEFLSSFRISRAREMLIVTQMSVEEIAVSCGYGDPLVFAKAFKKQVGMSPTAFRKKSIEDLKKKAIRKETSIDELIKDENV